MPGGNRIAVLAKASGSTIGPGGKLAKDGYQSMTTNGTAGVLASEDWGFVTGMCPAMQTLESVVAEIAPTNIPVLFLGESGTGKAMFAQRLHRLSARCDEPVVTFSCAAMDSAQLSAELRMGADRSKNSSLGTAGSVIFDEISELDSTCQRIFCTRCQMDMPSRNAECSARA